MRLIIGGFIIFGLGVIFTIAAYIAAQNPIAPFAAMLIFNGVGSFLIWLAGTDFGSGRPRKPKKGSIYLVRQKISVQIREGNGQFQPMLVLQEVRIRDSHVPIGEKDPVFILEDTGRSFIFSDEGYSTGDSPYIKFNNMWEVFPKQGKAIRVSDIGKKEVKKDGEKNLPIPSGAATIPTGGMEA